jgi:hypothetical protein
MASQSPSGAEIAKHVVVIGVFLITAPLVLYLASGSPIAFVLLLALTAFVGVRIVLALRRAWR